MRVRIGFVIAFVAALAMAQQPESGPKFDVVSIHVVPPGAPMLMREIGFNPVLPGGQYVNQRAFLPSMIGLAYIRGPANLSKQLVGLPKWAWSQNYDVSARAAENFPALAPRQNEEQVRRMMRAMLEDRFHLRIHTETRSEEVYHLVADRGGIKIKPGEAPTPPEKEGPVTAAYSDNYIRMIAKRSTMNGLAQELGFMLGSEVIDQTGWQGYFDFDVRWTSGGPDTNQFGAEGAAMLMSNLRSQFGLRLEKSTGPVPYWVVDSVDPPADN